MGNKDRFWEKIPILELSEEQWESICDGCCQCCAHKLIDDDTEQVFKTNVVCKYLDTEGCHCTVYPERQKLVPDCIKITPENAGELDWFPETCGYRLIANNKPLPKWHPLETGDPNTVKNAGVTITGKVICESKIDEDDLEDFIVDDNYFDAPVK
jgi:uncharacterized cysteine cluster protein YcgN (CxxCxxCC family)